MDKHAQLRLIKERLLHDMSLPLRDTAHHLVFGEGNPDAALYLLGEAPGRREDETGRPFVGQAGTLLERLLASIGMTREDVYISNIVRFRPPDNRPPTPTEIAAFADSVIAEIQTVNPTLIIPLGRYPLSKFMDHVTISAVHGKLFTIEWHGKKIRLVPFFHPAAALRRLEYRRALEEDFKKLPEIMKHVRKTKR